MLSRSRVKSRLSRVGAPHIWGHHIEARGTVTCERRKHCHNEYLSGWHNVEYFLTTSIADLKHMRAEGVGLEITAASLY